MDKLIPFDLTGVQLRPFPEFLEYRAFKPPKDTTTLIERLKTNTQFYLLNYIIIVGILNLLGGWAFCMPYFVLLLVVGATGVVLFVVLKGPLSLQGFVLSDSHKALALAAEALIILFATSTFTAFFVALLLSGLVVGLHAAMRERTLKSKMNTFVEGVSSEFKKD